MTPGQIIISFIIAATLTGLFAGWLRASGPWKGFWIFFSIIFIVTLAASEWVTPVGPSAYGYYWVPGLFVAVLFACLLAAVTPKGKDKDKSRYSGAGDPRESTGTPKIYFSPSNASPEKRIYQGDEPANSVALGGFFWIFIFLLMVVVIIGAFAER